MRYRLLVFLMLLISATAFADMVEIKGEGFINGTIESEDEKEVTFKGANGQVRKLERKDILFMERQTEAPPAQKALQKAEQTLKKKAVPVRKKKSSSGGGDATGAVRVLGKARVSIRESNARVEQGLRERNSADVPKKNSDKGRFSSLS